MTYATPECILYVWQYDAIMASEETDAPPSGGDGGGDDGDFPVGGLPGTVIPGWQPTNPTGGSDGSHWLWH
ncbi:MAG: hypothetical protein IJ012_07420 [Clostridia bacterium]|nr:hypothetical protein [Clostridia bacterium]